MLKMTQKTVESYLEDIICESTFETATEQARIEIQEQAASIDEIAHEIESKLEETEISIEKQFFSLLDELNWNQRASSLSSFIVFSFQKLQNKKVERKVRSEFHHDRFLRQSFPSIFD